MIEKSPKSEITQAASGAQTANSNGNPGGNQNAQHSGEAPAKLHEVVIAGVPLRLKSSHDEETVNELVALVDSKVREALHLTKSGSIQNASILAALHLAEEYILLKRKAKAELDHLEAKAIKVISELESSRVTTLDN